MQVKLQVNINNKIKYVNDEEMNFIYYILKIYIFSDNKSLKIGKIKITKFSCEAESGCSMGVGHCQFLGRPSVLYSFTT